MKKDSINDGVTHFAGWSDLKLLVIGVNHHE